MAEFAYRGRSPEGELVTGRLHGGSADAVAGRLVNIGITCSSLAAFAIGIGLGYIFYIGRWVDPVKFVNSNIFFYAIHKVILNRWYLNAMVYWCFVVAPLWLARGVFRYFEKTAIDYGMNDGVQKAVGWSAKVIQGTQTGVSQSYLFVFGAGLLFVVLILLM